MKTKYTRKELRQLVLQQAQGPAIKGITSYLEVRLYEYIAAQVKERQDKLKHLSSYHRGLVNVWAHPDLDYRGLTPGCHSCIEGKITHVRHSTKCTQNCLFCYYFNHKMAPMPKNQYEISNATKLFTLEEVKMVFDKQGRTVDAVGWLYKEPLMEMEKMEPVMQYLAKLGHFQYLYTNGVFATPENLVKLHHWGLNEIRFNLSATQFSKKAIENLAAAARLFEWVVIEIPMYEQVYDDFMDNKDAILETGLTHMNLAELQLNVNTWNHYDGDPTVLYRHRFGNLSPMTSRDFVYDIIELAEEEMWSVVINDCSNDTKYYRDLVPDPDFPGISTYEPKMGVPSATFYWIIDNILEEEVEIF